MRDQADKNNPQLPSASDFNAVVRSDIDPIVIPLGFAGETSGAPLWSRKESGDGTQFFGFQHHEKSVDPYAGGRFTVEFERSHLDRPFVGLSARARLDQLLTPRELEPILARQRQIIESLPRPPSSWVASYPGALRQVYLSDFEPNEKSRPGDLWLRYRTTHDISGWLELISRVLPSVLDRVARMDLHTLYMGRRIDLDADPLRPIK